MKGSRKNKHKVSYVKKYMQVMEDMISSESQEEFRTNYEPQVRLLSDDDQKQEERSIKSSITNIKAQKMSVLSSKDENINKNKIYEQNSIILGEMVNLNLKFQARSSNQSQNFDKKIESHPIEMKNQHIVKINHAENDSKQAKINSSIAQAKFLSQNQQQKTQIASQNRKKNMFLSNQQKHRLQYDIKSQKYGFRELIKKHKISRSTVKRYLNEINNFGEILIQSQKTRVVSGSKQNKIVKFIKQSIDKNPFLSQKQMAMIIKEQMGLQVSQQTVSLILKKENITKKKGMITYKEGNNIQNVQKRYLYAKMYQNLNENSIIFIDQTGFNECFELEYGYSLKGKRLIKEKPGKRGHKIVVILAMTYNQICHWNIKDLSVKTQDVASYIKQFDKKYRGCNIVLDNARVHRTQEVAEALISMDLKPIFLPPYSPQLNPIELLFARLKGIYKSKMVIKLQEPQKQLSRRVQICLKELSEVKDFSNYKKPVSFWIDQCLKRKKFNEVLEQK